MIADNVGDNVGDDAGMAADLFETYAVTIVGVDVPRPRCTTSAATTASCCRCCWARWPSRRSIIGTLLVRLPKQRQHHERALHRRARLGGALGTDLHLRSCTRVRRQLRHPSGSWTRIYLCALTGLVITALLVGITEYYTGTRFGPVKRIAEQSTTGHATNIIAGLAVGMQATALPVIVLVVRHHGRLQARRDLRHRHRRHRDALDGRHDRRARRLRADHRQRRRHRRDGRPAHEVRDKVTDPLDAVGNTTKAVTKGYAIGSAGLAALVLFQSGNRGAIPCGTSCVSAYWV